MKPRHLEAGWGWTEGLGGSPGNGRQYQAPDTSWFAKKAPTQASPVM
jgi:hypothetical protein